MNAPLAYVALEAAPMTDNKVSILEADKSWVTFETVLQEGDIVNRNGKIYPSDVLWQASQTTMIQEQIKNQNWFGEGNHPQEQSIQRQLYVDHNNISHSMLSFERRGNLFYSKVRSVPGTASGNLLTTSVKQGSIPAFSFRGLIEVDKAKSTPHARMVAKAQMVTYDHVTFPSHNKAYKTRDIAHESGSFELSLGNPELAQIACESSDTYNMIHDFIQSDPAKSKVSLQNGMIVAEAESGETVFIKPEHRALNLLSNL